MDDTQSAWSVTGQRQELAPGPSGEYVMGMTVSFRTAGGTTGSVFDPLATYSVDHVRELIEARLVHIAAVEGLKG